MTCFSQFASACKNWNEIDWLDWLLIFREGNKNSLKCLLWSNKNLEPGEVEDPVMEIV